MAPARVLAREALGLVWRRLRHWQVTACHGHAPGRKLVVVGDILVLVNRR